MKIKQQASERHVLTITVDNEAGILAKIAGLFTARGYNIDSLTVAEVDHTGHRSRITIVTSGTPHVIDQVEAQLSRLVSVYAVHDLTGLADEGLTWRLSKAAEARHKADHPSREDAADMGEDRAALSGVLQAMTSTSASSQRKLSLRCSSAEMRAYFSLSLRLCASRSASGCAERARSIIVMIEPRPGRSSSGEVNG